MATLVLAMATLVLAMATLVPMKPMKPILFETCVIIIIIIMNLLL
jgi:hypothetical protein